MLSAGDSTKMMKVLSTTRPAAEVSDRDAGVDTVDVSGVPSNRSGVIENDRDADQEVWGRSCYVNATSDEMTPAARRLMYATVAVPVVAGAVVIAVTLPEVLAALPVLAPEAVAATGTGVGISAAPTAIGIGAGVTIIAAGGSGTACSGAQDTGTPSSDAGGGGDVGALVTPDSGVTFDAGGAGDGGKPDAGGDPCGGRCNRLAAVTNLNDGNPCYGVELKKITLNGQKKVLELCGDDPTLHLNGVLVFDEPTLANFQQMGQSPVLVTMLNTRFGPEVNNDGVHVRELVDLGGGELLVTANTDSGKSLFFTFDVPREFDHQSPVPAVITLPQIVIQPSGTILPLSKVEAAVESNGNLFVTFQGMPGQHHVGVIAMFNVLQTGELNPADVNVLFSGNDLSAGFTIDANTIGFVNADPSDPKIVTFSTATTPTVAASMISLASVHFPLQTTFADVPYSSGRAYISSGANATVPAFVSVEVLTPMDPNAIQIVGLGGTGTIVGSATIESAKAFVAAMSDGNLVIDTPSPEVPRNGTPTWQSCQYPSGRGLGAVTVTDASLIIMAQKAPWGTPLGDPDVASLAVLNASSVGTSTASPCLY